MEGWIKRFAQTPYKDMTRLIKESRRRKRLEESTHYSQREEDAIIRLYRPGMSAADKEELLRVCRGRKFESIVRRSRTLCDRLIDSGIYDLARLPHIRYNAALKKRIQRAQSGEEECDVEEG